MTQARTSLQDFSLANPIYANGQVTAYTVDGSGNKTNTKATLYSAITGSTQAANPQTLTSTGKFKLPVYFDEAVILTITGLGSVPDHDTGIIRPSGIISGTGTPEGSVTAPIGTLYTRLDGGASTTLYVKESGTGNTGWVGK